MWLYFYYARVNKKTWLKTCWHHHCRHLRIPASVLMSECSALKMRTAGVEEKVQLLTQTKMKPHCETLMQWGHYLQLESALSWPDAWSQDKIILNRKKNVWGKSVWLFLWFFFTLAYRLGETGWSNAGSRMKHRRKVCYTKGLKQEKISFERTNVRAQLSTF